MQPTATQGPGHASTVGWKDALLHDFGCLVEGPDGATTSSTKGHDITPGHAVEGRAQGMARTWPTTEPRGYLAAAAYSWMVQSPAC